MRMSHSRVERYKQCPMSYNLHYNLKIRPTTQTSALYFGSAIGLVLNSLSLRKKDDCTEEELVEIEMGKDELAYFDTLLETIEINRVEQELAHSPNVRYYRKDYNPSILTEEDLAEISEYAEQVGLMLGDRPAKFSDFIEEYLSGQVHDTDILSFMNLQFFLSLRRKGRMMIQEFVTNFFPKIVKVHSIEREISIDMSLQTQPEFSDSMTGFIDIECDYKLCETYDKTILKPYTDLVKEIEKLEKTAEKLAKKGEDNTEYLEAIRDDKDILSKLSPAPGDVIRITGDFKTSSARYGTKKLTESAQLARYQFVAKNPYHGYFVLVKSLKTPKNGPRIGETHVDIQVLIAERDEVLENSVLDNDELVLEKIESGIFPKIEEKGCRRIFGARCQNYNYCWDNQNMRNLVDLSEKK